MNRHLRTPVSLLATLAVAVPLGLAATPSADATPAAATRAAAPYAVKPFHPSGHDSASLRAHWHAWMDRDLGSYDTTVQRSCFCTEIKPVVTEVHGRRVVSVHDEGTTKESRHHGYEMDALYRMIHRAHRTADRVHVTWTKDGVPRSITIDQDLNAADDEMYFSVKVRDDAVHPA